MSTCFAFLRAINVGGHTVTMKELCRLFEGLSFKNVETFIASGNVIFDSPSKSMPALQTKIEAHLRKSLGYEVKTFIRSGAELAALAQYEAFPEPERASARALLVALLDDPVPAKAKQSLLARETKVDAFHVHGREAYWLCHAQQSESPFFKVGLEKALGLPATVRNMNTIVKIAAKYAPMVE